jgi:hypothetical protein
VLVGDIDHDGCARAANDAAVGHFRITHAQALVASQLSHEGKAWFEERLGKDVKNPVVRLQRRAVGDGSARRELDRPGPMSVQIRR